MSPSFITIIFCEVRPCRTNKKDQTCLCNFCTITLIRFLHYVTDSINSIKVEGNTQNSVNEPPLSYPNLNKNMKTYIRFKQHKKLTPKHTTNGTISEVLPWNDQQYKNTGGLKPVLQAPNLTLIFCSGSQHFFSCSVLQYRK